MVMNVFAARKPAGGHVQGTDKNKLHLSVSNKLSSERFGNSAGNENRPSLIKIELNSQVLPVSRRINNLFLQCEVEAICEQLQDAASHAVTHSSAERLARNSIQLMPPNPDRCHTNGIGCIPADYVQFAVGD